MAPGEARTYNWKIAKKQGPTDPKFDCKTGAYYSTVDKVCISLHLECVLTLFSGYRKYNIRHLTAFICKETIHMCFLFFLL